MVAVSFPPSSTPITVSPSDSEGFSATPRLLWRLHLRLMPPNMNRNPQKLPQHREREPNQRQQLQRRSLGLLLAPPALRLALTPPLTPPPPTPPLTPAASFPAFLFLFLHHNTLPKATAAAMAKADTSPPISPSRMAPLCSSIKGLFPLRPTTGETVRGEMTCFGWTIAAVGEDVGCTVGAVISTRAG